MINKKLKIIFIILLLLLTFFIRVIPIRIAHFWDETVYLQHAEMMFSGRTNFDELAFRPPLLSILFFFVFLVKHSVVSASILTAILGALAPLFLFLIGKKMYGEKVGIVAGLILAFIPFLALNSNYLLTDVPVITLMAISFYLILFKEKKYALFLSGVFFSLSILMKFNALLLLFVFLFYFYLNRFKLKEVALFFFGAALIILPYFTWSQIKFGNFLIPFIEGQGMVLDKNEGILFYIFNLHKAFTFLVPLGLILWVFYLVRGIYKEKYPDLRKDLVLFFWMLIFILHLTITPHKELRYILPITAPIILLSVKGLFSFFERRKKQHKLLLIFLFIIFLLVSIFSTYAVVSLSKGIFVDSTISDEMKIADYLESIDYNGIIYTNHRWPVLAYYTGLETRIIIPYDERVYSLIPELMKDPGLIIGMLNVKEPQPNWLNQDIRFKHVKDIGEFFIYEYTPNELE